MNTCRRGHPQTQENVYVSAKGYVVCKACRRDAARQRYDQTSRALVPHIHRVIRPRQSVKG